MAVPEDVRPRLATEFDRFTLAAREGAARITVDSGLCLRRLPDGVAREMDASLARGRPPCVRPPPLSQRRRARWRRASSRG